MTVDEAILKAIAYLQQAPVPRGQHIDLAISVLEDTQVTPKASDRMVEDALAPVRAALIEANEAVAELNAQLVSTQFELADLRGDSHA